jgi:hypothetical protein
MATDRARKAPKAISPQRASAVDHDALPGDRSRRLRRDEAHGLRERAAGRSRDVGLLVAGDDGRGDRVDRDAERRERPRPAADQTHLGAPGRRVGGSARQAAIEHFGVDLHDPARSPRRHAG